MHRMVWLCCLATLALPSFSTAGSLQKQPKKTSITTTGATKFSFVAGETSAVIHFLKAHPANEFQAVLLSANAGSFIPLTIPAFYAFQNQNYSPNAIVVNGP